MKHNSPLLVQSKKFKLSQPYDRSHFVWQARSTWAEPMGRDYRLPIQRASLVAQSVKCLPAMWETWVRSPDQEDPLEKEMATHSSTLAWKIPWMEEPGRLQSMGSQIVGDDWATSLVQNVDNKFHLLAVLHSLTWEPMKKNEKIRPWEETLDSVVFCLCSGPHTQGTGIQDTLVNVRGLIGGRRSDSQNERGKERKGLQCQTWRSMWFLKAPSSPWFWYL